MTRLIDADALKKAIIDATYNFEQIPIRVDKVQEIIDNAPTVEPCYQTTSCLDCKMYDKEKHNCPRFCEVIRDLVDEVEERPTGEWIEFKGGYYKCDNCGEVKRAKKNFCSKCGADMRVKEGRE